MKVPEHVRKVFDSYPVTTLPPYLKHPSNDENTLYVYSMQKSTGLPLDPHCLMMFSFLKLAGIPFKTEIAPPQLSKELSLPLYCASEFRTTIFDHLVKHYWSDVVSNAQFAVYKALLDTWVNDAWYATIIEERKKDAMDIVYGDEVMKTSPTLVAAIFRREMYTAFSQNYDKTRRRHGDNYVYDSKNPKNIVRVSNAFTSLSNQITEGDEKLSVLDVAVFGYIYPILTLLQGTELHEQVPEVLKLHCDRVLLQIKQIYIINEIKR